MDRNFHGRGSGDSTNARKSCGPYQQSIIGFGFNLLKIPPRVASVILHIISITILTKLKSKQMIIFEFLE